MTCETYPDWCSHTTMQNNNCPRLEGDCMKRVEEYLVMFANGIRLMLPSSTTEIAGSWSHSSSWYTLVAYNAAGEVVAAWKAKGRGADRWAEPATPEEIKSVKGSARPLVPDSSYGGWAALDYRQYTT